MLGLLLVQWARLHALRFRWDILQKWLHQEYLEKKIKIEARAKRSLWWWKDQRNLSGGLHWAVAVMLVSDNRRKLMEEDQQHRVIGPRQRPEDPPIR